MRTKLALAVTVLVGCAVDDSPEISETSEELLGAASFGTDCTTPKLQLLSQALRWGRTAAGSRAFEQCVEQSAHETMTFPPGIASGPYRRCAGDPFFAEPLDQQIARALDAARSGNDVRMLCTGAANGGNASAGVRPYDTTDPEQLDWSSWLDAALASPRVGAVPFAQTANTIWHEAMHQHGYVHGITSPPAECGYGTDSSWNFQRNTMPYIIGNCIAAVLDTSAAMCGALDTCGYGNLRLVTGFGASTCECAADPNLVGLRSANAFTHVTTTANTSGATTTLQHYLLDRNPNALVQFTHTFRPTGAAGGYNGNRPVAYYNATTERWVIQNQHGAAMPIGTGFFVRIGRGALHRTSYLNTTGHITRIDHPLANGNPDAILTVAMTPHATGYADILDDHPIGVYYDGPTRRWTIFNQDLAAMPAELGFTIEVETAINRGLHLPHVVTAANQSGYLTRLSNPWLDGKPDARFLVTPNWSRGSFVYNPNDFGVWYDGVSWWIYNEAGAGIGAAMPIGAAFNIEVLKDEIQTWVRVNESAANVDTTIHLLPGDRLHVHGSQRIYSGRAGSSFTGPEGENAWPYNVFFPHLTANRYSLLGRFALDGYFAAGRDVWRWGPSSLQNLSLRTNDDVPANGSGHLEAEVRVFR